jgi:hypothetical protein
VPIVITLRNAGTAAIVVGLLVALFTFIGSGSDRPFILAGLLVLTGIGLRIEAAIRAGVVPRVETRN